MSIETDIFTALGGLVDSRVYPGTFPQPPAEPLWPAIRYTPVGGTVYPDACGSGLEATDDTRVQFDVVAHTFDACRTLTSQVRTALQAIATQPVVLDGPPLFLFDAETKTHRGVLDATFYPSSA